MSLPPVVAYVKRGEVEIDPACEVAAVPTGIWVSAWIFVDKDSINTEIEDSMPQDEDADLAVHYMLPGERSDDGNQLILAGVVTTGILLLIYVAVTSSLR